MDCGGTEGRFEIERFRITEEQLEAAYESVSPPCRAAIKTAIALAIFHHGRMPQERGLSIKDEFAGFAMSMEEKPIPNALLCVPATYPAPALLCAAAMLPILAGVEDIRCILVGSTPSSKLLVTLELCGLEQIFACSPAETLAYVDSVETNGMIVLLHENSLEEMRKVIENSGNACINIARLPIIRMGANIDRDLVKFAFGDKIYADSAHPDCVTGEDMGGGGEARLVLGPGCECFWLFKDLTPANFRKRVGHFSLLEE